LQANVAAKLFPEMIPIFVEFAAASECISVAGWSSHGIQVLDVGINVRLYLADFVYRATQP
jgi:hypothetical protein